MTDSAYMLCLAVIALAVVVLVLIWRESNRALDRIAEIEKRAERLRIRHELARREEES